MEKTLNLKINCLPTLTWNFLKLNRAEVNESVVLNGRGQSIIQNIPNGVIVGNTDNCGDCNGCDRDGSEKIKDIATGMGEEADRFFSEVCDGTLMVRAKRGMEIREPLCLDYRLGSGDGTAVRQEIIAEEGSTVTVIMDYTSEREDRGFFGVQTRLHARKGAVIRLIKIELLGRNYLHFDDIGALVEDGGAVELVQMELGGGRNYVGVNTELAGYKSSFTGHTGYLCMGSQSLDMNYYIGHSGKKSESSLIVRGALKDKAKKNFRGTIDLKHGAKGACGDEQEETLLLSEGVLNKTLPVILCDEDDVEGSHGATIGRLSSDILFYMQSRGMSPGEAEILMTKAKLNSIRNQITDEKSIGRIQHYMEEAFDNER